MPIITSIANASAAALGFVGVGGQPYNYETAGGLLVQTNNYNFVGYEAITAFSSSDDYSWVVPAGVTKISAVAIGGGAGGANSWNNDGRYDSGPGGSGGALSYINDFPVTPGQTLVIYAGAGGGAYRSSAPSGPANEGCAGRPSGIVRSGVVLLKALGGGGCNSNLDPQNLPGGQASDGVGDVKYSGGTGDSSGLSAGADGGASASYTANGPSGSSGNGLGISVYGNTRVNRTDSPVNPDDGGEYGGVYGGGGTGADDGDAVTLFYGGFGGVGAVRIIWNTDPNSPRLFPFTNVGLDFSGGNETIVTT